MVIAVLATIGGTPFAGVAWQALHYLEGFRRLGFDVYYIEDTDSWPYDPEANAITHDARYAAGYVERTMRSCGLAGRWAYVAPDGAVWGIGRRGLRRLLARCDGLVNLTGATILRGDYLEVPVRIYLETDPVRPQIEVAEGRRKTIELLAAHTHHFSFGEKLGQPDCGVPVERFAYLPTRQPVVLDWWSGFAPANGRYTTVASWRQTEKDVSWRGETYYWSKDREFMKVLELPRRTSVDFELALAFVNERENDGARELLRSFGWRVRDALGLSKDIHRYSEFIIGSRGEFTVAKDQNVRLRSGWFSDRSACYLAAGNPVVTQDTGFGDVLPTGAGLFAFSDLEDAVAAVEAIEADYDMHARAARDLAREFFSAAKVLESLVERASLG